MFTQQVVNELLKFLTLDDLKSYRLVSREWHSTSESCLRKSSVIRLKTNILRPSTFIDVCKYSNVPASGFRVCYSFLTSELEKFFDECGNHIEYIDFHKCTLCQLEQTGKKRLKTYDISPWFVHTTKLSNLRINSSKSPKDTILEISFQRLLPLQTVTLLGLGGLVVHLSPTKENTRLVPLNICLFDVMFKQDAVIVENMNFNEIIDFGHAKNIVLAGNHEGTSTFDMAAQCFNAKYVRFMDVTIENWKSATGTIDFLDLCDHRFVEKNGLRLKQLLHRERTIDLSALPETIEKLGLYDCYDFLSSEPNPLPNLKYFSFNTLSPYMNILTLLSTCVYLRDLQIFQCQPFRDWRLQLDLLPKSIKNLKINGLNFYFHDEDPVVELETLVLENTHKWTFIDQTNAIESALTKIKPKNLVIVWCDHQGWDTSALMAEVVLVHTEIERIIIGTRGSKYMECDLHQYHPFEKSMKQYVDKKSNYYQFENGIGKSITRAEFDVWKKMNGLNSENIYGL